MTASTARWDSKRISGSESGVEPARCSGLGVCVDGDLREEVDEFADSVAGNAQTVRDQLEGAQFGSFGVVFAALDFNYSWKTFQGERLANGYDESLAEEERGLLDDIKTALSLFGRRANT